ncbi:dihydroorotate dehydrogenase [Citroniella saccharovorans]|uniref:Dihydroorotate dehydrogenase n=1 Tax=Citroniella saccharovorans TaxID=2053367 RepID=A0AAW9MY49_9FIRM|nr:dihydroorotate dehydrogenase [Citroniella saccharovorans]MEB3429572.1 dihydroorotate dehydrogenase [Citroniella saccharovorans]
MSLSVNLAGIELQNPIIAASGTFGFGREFSPYLDLNRLGAISTKGLTIVEKPGNTGIRIHETPSGIMNSIGLQNPSIRVFIEKEYENLKKYKMEIIPNLGGNNLEQYIEGAKLLDTLDINIIELNISCPNVKEGGMAFGMTCEAAGKVVSAVRKVTNKKLMVKLSPNAHNLVDVSKECEANGADILSLVNTFNALAVDVDNRKAIFDNITAGLSGPCIRPIAVRMAWEVCKSVNIPVVGMGGIMNYKDALEFIMVGCSAVQVGTANFINPKVMIEIIDDLENYLKKNKFSSLEEIRGII